MVLFVLFLFTFTLAIAFLTTNVTCSKSELKKYLKQAEGIEEGHGRGILGGSFHKLIVVLKVPYYMYIQALPNYIAAQRMMDSLGQTFCIKLPFKSSEYIVTSDPVDARCIMADSAWPDRVPVGFYCQDAGFDKPYGLVFGGGKPWKAASRVTGKLLHQLGFLNQVSMEGRFAFEMQELEREFDVKIDANGGVHTFCPRHTFRHLSINVILYILLGKRRPFEEAAVTQLIKCIRNSSKKISIAWTILEVLPFLRHFPRLTFLKSFHDMSNTIYDTFREVIAEKRRVGKYKEHVEDFVDGMLQHVDASGSCQDGLNDENMLVVLRDLLLAGVSTTSSTLEYALLYMALHPEIQVKVQVEIDSILGADRVPAYEDRKRMPYTQAVLNEVYRIGSPIPATARAKQTSNKRSFALISLYGIHRNELFYDKPNEFKPERFLSKEDPAKVINTENLMPFGYGRRSCPAEPTARQAVFVSFVIMMQKYLVKLSSSHPQPSMKNTSGLARSPPPYYVTIKKRHH